MPKLRRLSAKEIVKFFQKLDFKIESQKGSHIKLQRRKENVKQTLIIPNHKEVDTGTLRSIIRQASQYVNTVKLEKYFYSK